MSPEERARALSPRDRAEAFVRDVYRSPRPIVLCVQHVEMIDKLEGAFAAAIRAAVAVERERCAKVADSSPHRALLCPFQKANNWGAAIDKDDPCPVCKQTGHDDGSKCTATLAGSIAAAIRKEPT